MEAREVEHTGKAGQPRIHISEEEIQQAEAYALDNCKTSTICGLMGWSRQVVDGREDILRRLTRKRQEHTAALRAAQSKHMKSTPVMAIFLGKQSVEMGGLGQVDKTEIKHGVSEQSAEFAAWLKGADSLPTSEVKALPEAPTSPLPVIEAERVGEA